MDKTYLQEMMLPHQAIRWDLDPDKTIDMVTKEYTRS